MICSFQDFENLYLIMELYLGGDLRYHLNRNKHFSEEQSKFLISNIILGLEYIHEKKILHRDIKPENLVFDNKGYLHITDFGIAKVYHENNSKETSGTPGYMSPEVMCSINHNFSVDFFALGVILFELIFGKRPYHGKNKKEIKNDILSRAIKLNKNDIPYNWNFLVCDLVNGLLQRKQDKRLGYHGIKEIKEHKWFKEFSWNKIYKKEVISPYIPKIGLNFDKKFCEAPDNIGEETKEKYNKIKNSDEYKILFENYTFCNFNSFFIKKKQKLKISNRSSFFNDKNVSLKFFNHGKNYPKFNHYNYLSQRKNGFQKNNFMINESLRRSSSSLNIKKENESLYLMKIINQENKRLNNFLPRIQKIKKSSSVDNFFSSEKSTAIHTNSNLKNNLSLRKSSFYFQNFKKMFYN